MIKKIIIISLLLISCTYTNPTAFSSKALNDVFVTLGSDSIQFKKILKKHKGKKILIDVWASWCKDCIVSLPKLKQLQNEYTDVVFVFLSLDKGTESWRRGIEKFKLKGEHYFMQSGWNGNFGDFLRLNWIPRYLVVNEKGTITLFKATKATDTKITEALKKHSE
jgi:thiol-disulfide isomerase/thioredoxin